MVEARYSVPKEGSPYMTTGSLYVFFKKEEKDQVVAVFKKNISRLMFRQSLGR